ncbi:uncharacterized protein LOC126204189 [Schistocerca nitens]|uniref:uncharacterized protein LOC126204189 n=1 Tax=Schistocerca nitens TaxID=7011 RepID=UPI0021179A63|nr:uncharacterized protein LOC126204189 [Schistocerca nitens]
MAGRRKGSKIAAAIELPVDAIGKDRGRSRRHKKKQRTEQQCFKCQRVGHIAKVCRGTLACLKCAEAHDTRDCTKPRDAAAKCVNCGGAHAANSRSCAYVRGYRNKMAAPRPAEVPGVETDVPPPRSRGGGGPCRRETTTDDALAAFHTALAAERAAMREELVAVHRQLQQLREELRVLRKTPTPTASSTASRPAGVDASTQTEPPAPPVDVTGGVEAPMDIEVEQPALPPDGEVEPRAHDEETHTETPPLAAAEAGWLPLPKADSVPEGRRVSS